MSAKLMGQVYELQLGHSQQSIALALADHGHDDGSHIFPGHEYLEWKTGYSERQIIRLLQELESIGLLVPVDGQAVGRGNRQEYFMDTEAVPKKQPFKEWKQSLKGDKTASFRKGDILSKGDKRDTEKVTPCPIKGDKRDTRHIEYPRVEPSYEPKSIEPSERETRASSPQNSTSTLRIETPPATVHSSAPRAAPLVDMSDPQDPRFTTPFYPAVANACGIRPEPMKTSLPMRSRIANAAAKFERDGYTLEQIAVMRENWTMPNPPSPDQLYDRADSLLTARKTNGTNGNHNDISQHRNERAGERLSERERRFQERQDIRREYLERFGPQVAGGAR